MSDIEKTVVQRRDGLLWWGNTPVPFVASWTGEDVFTVAPCRFSRNQLAVCQSEAPGVGRPEFGKPHMNRQRQAINIGLCDLCGKPLRDRTKVSLSHADFQAHAAPGSATAILQVEPLLHRECAAKSVKFCPALRRDIAAGALFVRQITRWRAQFALLKPQYVGEYVPGYVGDPKRLVIGHAKVELIHWIDRNIFWLGDAP